MPAGHSLSLFLSLSPSLSLPIPRSPSLAMVWSSTSGSDPYPCARVVGSGGGVFALGIAMFNKTDERSTCPCSWLRKRACLPQRRGCSTTKRDRFFVRSRHGYMAAWAPIGGGGSEQHHGQAARPQPPPGWRSPPPPPPILTLSVASVPQTEWFGEPGVDLGTRHVPSSSCDERRRLPA